MAAQLSPQRHDMAVNGMVRGRVVAALNGPDDLLSRERASVALHQEEQDPEFGFRQLQWPALQQHLTRGRTESQSLDFNQAFLFAHDSSACTGPPKNNFRIGPEDGLLVRQGITDGLAIRPTGLRQFIRSVLGR